MYRELTDALFFTSASLHIRSDRTRLTRKTMAQIVRLHMQLDFVGV